MSLYRLLELMAGRTGKDRQVEIDAIIKKHETVVEETISPQRSKPETVYTRLRNEQIHRGHVPLATVRSEMETHLPGLIAIVREVIKRTRPAGSK
jgi:hypothetical protein